MIKKLVTYTINNTLHRIYKNTIVNAKPLQTTGTYKLQPYQILLRNSLQNMIKLPSPAILKELRSRGITRIMAANHSLSEDTDQILQAHIECLYALIYRIQPSIQAISMFTEKVYQQIQNIKQVEITSPSLLNLLKPTIISKIVKITQSIESFYNESFRSLISALIIKLLQKSVLNQSLHKNEMKKLTQQFNLFKTGERPLKDQQGNIINSQLVDKWFERQSKKISQNYRVLSDLDYWSGFQFVISMEYYSELFLISNIGRLEKVLQKDIRVLSINQLMVKIKCVMGLQKFKNHKEVRQKQLRSLNFCYNKMMEQYFKILSSQNNIIDIINSSEPIIQSTLLTNFLTHDHYLRAKKVYSDIFKTVLNVLSNGALLVDIKRLRGLFQLILILYTHQDTKQIHQILTKLEKIMVLYPLERFARLETHCFVAQKYGFKSDYFADNFLKELFVQRQKLQRNRGHLHNIHQITRQIQLASKFLIYKRIAAKPSKEQLQLAASMAHSLFDPNIWYCLSELSESTQIFLTQSSFSHQLYFHKAGIFNLPSKYNERKRTEQLCTQMGIKNINKQYMQVIQDLKLANNRFVLKLNHLSYWEHNAHARMATLLQLANHSIEYLRRTNPQEVNNFTQQFFTKTIGNSFFYNILKQKFAYPTILSNLIELMANAQAKNYSIQNRDLQSIKRLYQTQLLKLVKSQKPSFLHFYQDHLNLVQLNRIMIPLDRQVYGLSNIGNCASLSLLYQAMKRFEKRKEYFRMQVQTYLKFNKAGDISIQTNHLQYPYLADIKIKIKDEHTVILFQSYQAEPNHFINYRQVQMQKQSETYWKKKGYQVFIVRCEKDLQNLMKKVMKTDAKSQK